MISPTTRRPSASFYSNEDDHFLSPVNSPKGKRPTTPTTLHVNAAAAAAAVTAASTAAFSGPPPSPHHTFPVVQAAPRLQSRGGGSAGYRTGRFIRKFGPLILIVTLLFAVKYLLIAIHLNVHSIKSGISEQCADGGSNGTNLMTSAGGHDHWVPYKMVGRGTYGYVQFSAYRISTDEIVAVGFGAKVLREAREVTSCVWHGGNGKTIEATPSLLFPETDPDQYETIVINLKLQSPIASHHGGYVACDVDSDQVVLYREDKNSEVHVSLANVHNFRTTFCTWPIVDRVVGERLEEWILIHKAVGAEHVIGYDGGGMDKDTAGHLAKFIKEGFLEMTPMREISHFRIKDRGAILAGNDCLFRSLLSSKWVAFLDWDDVLQLDSPKFLSILLDDHEAAPWLSHGARWWGVDHCAALDFGQDPKKLFPQERMVYHWPHFFCAEGEAVENKLCPGGRGHRYIIANTEKVRLVNKNEALEPATGGIQLSSDDVRHEHYDNVHKVTEVEKYCKELHGPNDGLDWWVRDPSVGETIAEFKKVKRSL